MLDLHTYIPSDQEQKFPKIIDSIAEDATTREWIAQEGLKYLCGYVAFRFKDKCTNLGEPTRNLKKTNKDWIRILSDGGLMYPSQNLIEAGHIMEKIFQKFHGSTLSDEDKIFTKVANMVYKEIKHKIPYIVIHCLVRTRTYIRLRELNKQIYNNAKKNQKQNKMRKLANVKYNYQ